jgi:hypothetical protein
MPPRRHPRSDVDQTNRSLDFLLPATDPRCEDIGRINLNHTKVPRQAGGNFARPRFRRGMELCRLQGKDGVPAERQHRLRGRICLHGQRPRSQVAFSASIWVGRPCGRVERIPRGARFSGCISVSRSITAAVHGDDFPGTDRGWRWGSARPRSIYPILRRWMRSHQGRSGLVAPHDNFEQKLN